MYDPQQYKDKTRSLRLPELHSNDDIIVFCQVGNIRRAGKPLDAKSSLFKLSTDLVGSTNAKQSALTVFFEKEMNYMLATMGDTKNALHMDAVPWILHRG